MKKTWLKHVATILLMTFCITGCGGNLYEDNKSGYTIVSSINGVTFDIPSNFLSQATAITSITDDKDYRSGTYLYKNGRDQYILFNIQGVIIVVQQGTTYDLKNNNDKITALKSTSTCDVWITQDEKIPYKEQKDGDAYKLIVDVYADASITSTLYATCYGKFASVQYGDYECSLFAGIPGADEKDVSAKQKETLEHIAKSLSLNMSYFTSGNNTEKDTTDNVSEAESKTEATEVEESTETTETQLPEESEKGEYSDAYNMLSIGETGLLYALNNAGTENEKTYITIQKLYTDEDALAIIQNFCESEDCVYEYAEPPVGHSWHVVEYMIEKHPDDLYVNIKIKGLDGESLKFRGQSTSTRTYDIFYQLTESEEGYTKAYCYYAVPNGCMEYMLECGNDTMAVPSTACYKIEL